VRKEEALTNVLDGQIQEIERKLGVEFKDKQKLATALTHRSYLNEDTSAKEHNELLEFLGDAVLELAVTDHLYRKHKDCDEGRLTTWRSAIVNGKNLLAIGERLGIIDHIRMSKGERLSVDSGGKSREWIIANAMEALIGAVYLDLGLGEAKLFIDVHILTGSTQVLRAHRDWKSELQELVQERFGYTPHYRVLGSSGPDHDKRFVMGLFIGETRVSSREGTSKLDAQTAAAKRAIETIETWQTHITPKRKRDTR
jgi:ribonuclease-3